MKQKKYQKTYNDLVPLILNNLRYIKEQTEYTIYRDHVECLICPMEKAVEILGKRKKPTESEDNLLGIWAGMVGRIQNMETASDRGRDMFKNLVEIILQQKEGSYEL